MNYDNILKDIEPNKEEIAKVHGIAYDVIEYINNKAKEENIDAIAKLVGSVAKGTWLSGNADIDIFINFPLETKEEELKEKGLYLAYECNNALNGIAEEHYASHPYITSHINGCKVDIVPCYNIKDAEELKSAVDRTLLHTNYILANLKEEQKKEVLLLKKFMKEVGVYGSEFKVGGFAGYLCEILILQYETFENTLKKTSHWKKNTIIDLENYGTSKKFKEPLIAIDPTDKNRNVGAALTTQKMGEFIASSRNFIKDPKIDYFYPKKTTTPNKEELKNLFQDRESKTLSLTFNIPDIPIDNLYPQIKKTSVSLKEKLEFEGFNVINSSYWTDEKKIAIIIIELDTWTQSKYKIHEGPKIWNKEASTEFLAIHGNDCYLKGEQWVLKKPRTIRTPEEYINFVLKKDNIHILKLGKNLKDLIADTYNLAIIEELLLINNYCNNDFLDFLNDYLNPGKLLKR
ncbi:tRNA nucleotidyltransferase, second domain [Methanobrevibacter cuticularis]|uniref:CCA-adding enzyme n=1 Tax=Methanobrevibacter cuticularis TaxID=47311 RepID=A0A166EXM2_9EURY|nr:CCA tRNA nucleotidyltransferase [Methanobrevibacter cuticularis]KZX17120.1 tRNA nucleotidyltransferase, second domain [Methanobrevibacter cuticularis]